MKRRPDEPELMAAQEASSTLGVQQTNLRTVAGLPEPYQKLAAATLWRATEIRALAWTRAHKREAFLAHGKEGGAADSVAPEHTNHTEGEPVG